LNLISTRPRSGLRRIPGNPWCLAELIVGSGAGISSQVQVYLRTGLPASAGPDQTFDPFGLAPRDGVYVG
jgi:hypothetical protein